MTIAYPDYRKALLALGEADQQEIKSHYQRLKAAHESEKASLEAELSAHCHQRAARMLEILDQIRQPRISYVGSEGSQIISLLALHSYIDEMKRVLDAYEGAYEQNPADVYQESIPSLTDRIMVYEQRRQRFGSNWFTDAAGKFHLVPVEDFAHMNERRTAFGLGPRMKPTVYAIGEEKYPLGQGEVTEDDQKAMTDEEYADYIKHMIRPEK